MGKVADIRLGWKKSASADVVRVKIVTRIDGMESNVETENPDVQEIRVTARPGSALQFQVFVTDSEGNTTPSTIYDHVFGDFEAPQPATDLFHEVLAIREEDVEA